MKYAATGEIAAETEVRYSARTAAKPVKSIPSPLPRFLPSPETSAPLD